MSAAPPPGSRALTDADIPSLAGLMVAAYRGTVDDEGESEEDAAHEVARCFAGAYGPVLGAASYGQWEGDALRSAVLVTLYEREPCFTFCMTHPAAKHRGYCRALMRHSLALLPALGFTSAHLYVTAANESAVRLYRQLGFATPLTPRTPAP